ncbi:DUF2635 domain-containing protein [Xanthobacter flavus]|uniref:DUF2635 domain-containing protein n=1 Tax=Xanthobacter flavus TaxID=281 RepID=UPI001AE1CF00
MPRLRARPVLLDGKLVPSALKDRRTNRCLPPEGRNVPLDDFWVRRLSAGEVEIVPDPQPAEPEPAAEAPSGDQPA